MSPERLAQLYRRLAETYEQIAAELAGAPAAPPANDARRPKAPRGGPRLVSPDKLAAAGISDTGAAADACQRALEAAAAGDPFAVRRLIDAVAGARDELDARLGEARRAAR